jgi:DNA-binding GntR family transcriptional regulator
MKTGALRHDMAADRDISTPTVPAKLGAIRPETLRQQVENALREAIISGRLAPGARLIERELCETLGVSRTSVREALRRLEAEKLVRSIPHKGPVVAVMSRQEAAELYALRGLLEGFAAHEFARLASDAALARAGDAVRQLRAAARSRSPAAVLQAKAALYDVLLDHCGNMLVKEVLTSLYSRVNLLRATSLAQPERLSSSLAEIDALYGALKARDAAAAQQLARLHVANAQQAAMQELEPSSLCAAARGLGRYRRRSRS